ncbi:14409_t:CDS:2 [Funneliformis caledonium]|uniref:14409_t:CDS:1 n=1 Tax=Funneliformis caledonium TaxID=1117310 RepID=A0A9N9E9B2_9GLOM|nr:14409_t:CDS:2 [Funneliformis caledonium]
MYGNVGLSTPRGSGTNGYVVRNLSFIRPRKDIQIESLDEAKANASTFANRKPNQEILDHERKRQVELKCITFQQELEEAGKTEEEIEQEVNSFRQSMLRSIDIVKDNKNIQEYQTHHLSQAKITENEKMMRALGINSQYYVEGAAFDRELQETKKQERIIQREKDLEEHQKWLEEKERELIERDKKWEEKWEEDKKKKEKLRNLLREKESHPVEKDDDREYYYRREEIHKKDYKTREKSRKRNSSVSESGSESSNTESNSSRDTRGKRYHMSRRVSKQGDSDINEKYSRRNNNDHSDRETERYHNSRDHRMPRSPKRRQGSPTRRRNRDNSIPSSRRNRDGSLSPLPRRNRDSVSPFQRYRDNSFSPSRRSQRNHSSKEFSTNSERKSFRSVSPPSYRHYQDDNVRSRYRNEFKSRRDIYSSEKRNDYSPRSNNGKA